MNSQRLEEIVAELMKPISDVRRSFDINLSALLEEYLTEAELRELAAEERGAAPVIPNFAELALLLQQSASVYSRKVDCLYQHVLSVSDSLHHSKQEIRNAVAAPAAAADSRHKRKAAAAAAGFAALVLEGSAAARRDAAGRPPPMLPRMYVELEPRAPSDADAPLCDYAGEPVGLLADFHVAWRLQDGFLVEELRGDGGGGGGGAGSAALRPVPLTERSAAIAAAAPPDPPPLESPPLELQSPCCSPTPPPAASTPLPDARRKRKRRSEDAPDGPLRFTVTPALRRKLQSAQEFSVPDAWRRRVLRARTAAVRAHRRRLRDAYDFQTGFLGWSGAEVTRLAAAARRPDVSDDDGFFERSSLVDSDMSRVDDCSANTQSLSGAVAEGSSWLARVQARAAAGEARGRDLRGAAAALLAACGALGPRAVPFTALLARAAKKPDDVPELFLATLFQACAGNVEIIQGPPLSLDSFSVRLLSDDRRLHTTQDDADLSPAERTAVNRQEKGNVESAAFTRLGIKGKH